MLCVSSWARQGVDCRAMLLKINVVMVVDLHNSVRFWLWCQRVIVLLCRVCVVYCWFLVLKRYVFVVCFHSARKGTTFFWDMQEICQKNLFLIISLLSLLLFFVVYVIEYHCLHCLFSCQICLPLSFAVGVCCSPTE